MAQETTWALVQARCQSTRLPGKVLRPFAGETPLLGWIVERGKRIGDQVRVGVITGDDAANQPIIDWCRHAGIPWFVGSEEDVLDRYTAAAKAFGADHVIRLTADNPLLDDTSIRALLDEHLACGADYSSNKADIGSGLPVGIGAEIFSRAVLERLNQMELSSSHREHVNGYILENQSEFSVYLCQGTPHGLAENFFTIDTLEDFQRVEAWALRAGSLVTQPDAWRVAQERQAR